MQSLQQGFGNYSFRKNVEGTNHVQQATQLRDELGKVRLNVIEDKPTNTTQEAYEKAYFGDISNLYDKQPDNWTLGHLYQFLQPSNISPTFKKSMKHSLFGTAPTLKHIADTLASDIEFIYGLLSESTFSLKKDAAIRLSVALDRFSALRMLEVPATQGNDRNGILLLQKVVMNHLANFSRQIHGQIIPKEGFEKTPLTVQLSQDLINVRNNIQTGKQYLNDRLRAYEELNGGQLFSTTGQLRNKQIACVQSTLFDVACVNMSAQPSRVLKSLDEVSEKFKQEWRRIQPSSKKTNSAKAKITQGEIKICLSRTYGRRSSVADQALNQQAAWLFQALHNGGLIAQDGSFTNVPQGNQLNPVLQRFDTQFNGTGVVGGFQNKLKGKLELVMKKAASTTATNDSDQYDNEVLKSVLYFIDMQRSTLKEQVVSHSVLSQVMPSKSRSDAERIVRYLKSGSPAKFDKAARLIEAGLAKYEKAQSKKQSGETVPLILDDPQVKDVLELRDEKGGTLLHAAARCDLPLTTKHLSEKLKSGPGLDIEDFSRQTPLYVAVESQSENAMVQLKESGANPDYGAVNTKKKLEALLDILEQSVSTDSQESNEDSKLVESKPIKTPKELAKEKGFDESVFEPKLSLNTGESVPKKEDSPPQESLSTPGLLPSSKFTALTPLVTQSRFLSPLLETDLGINMQGSSSGLVEESSKKLNNLSDTISPFRPPIPSVKPKSHTKKEDVPPSSSSLSSPPKSNFFGSLFGGRGVSKPSRVTRVEWPSGVDTSFKTTLDWDNLSQLDWISDPHDEATFNKTFYGRLLTLIKSNNLHQDISNLRNVVEPILNAALPVFKPKAFRFIPGSSHMQGYTKESISQLLEQLCSHAFIGLNDLKEDWKPTLGSKVKSSSSSVSVPLRSDVFYPALSGKFNPEFPTNGNGNCGMNAVLGEFNGAQYIASGSREALHTFLSKFETFGEFEVAMKAVYGEQLGGELADTLLSSMCEHAGTDSQFATILYNDYGISVKDHREKNSVKKSSVISWLRNSNGRFKGHNTKKHFPKHFWNWYLEYRHTDTHCTKGSYPWLIESELKVISYLFDMEVHYTGAAMAGNMVYDGELRLNAGLFEEMNLKEGVLKPIEDSAQFATIPYDSLPQQLKGKYKESLKTEGRVRVETTDLNQHSRDVDWKLVEYDKKTVTHVLVKYEDLPESFQQELRKDDQYWVEVYGPSLKNIKGFNGEVKDDSPRKDRGFVRICKFDIPKEYWNMMYPPEPVIWNPGGKRGVRSVICTPGHYNLLQRKEDKQFEMKQTQPRPSEYKFDQLDKKYGVLPLPYKAPDTGEGGLQLNTGVKKEQKKSTDTPVTVQVNQPPVSSTGTGVKLSQGGQAQVDNLMKVLQGTSLAELGGQKPANSTAGAPVPLTAQTIKDVIQHGFTFNDHNGVFSVNIPKGYENSTGFVPALGLLDNYLFLDPSAHNRIYGKIEFNDQAVIFQVEKIITKLPKSETSTKQDEEVTFVWTVSQILPSGDVKILKQGDWEVGERGNKQPSIDKAIWEALPKPAMGFEGAEFQLFAVKTEAVELPKPKNVQRQLQDELDVDQDEPEDSEETSEDEEPITQVTYRPNEGLEKTALTGQNKAETYEKVLALITQKIEVAINEGGVPLEPSLGLLMKSVFELLGEESDRDVDIEGYKAYVYHDLEDTTGVDCKVCHASYELKYKIALAFYKKFPESFQEAWNQLSDNFFLKNVDYGHKGTMDEKAAILQDILNTNREEHDPYITIGEDEE